MRILYIPNNCSATGQLPFLVWAAHELRMVSYGLKTVSKDTSRSRLISNDCSATGHLSFLVWSGARTTASKPSPRRLALWFVDFWGTHTVSLVTIQGVVSIQGNTVLEESSKIMWQTVNILHWIVHWVKYSQIPHCAWVLREDVESIYEFCWVQVIQWNLSLRLCIRVVSMVGPEHPPN